MFSLDNRAGNVITTVTLFAVGATILYVARGAFFILLLSLLFAYLLDPVVTWVQQHARLRTEQSRLGDCSGVFRWRSHYWQGWLRVWATPGGANKEF